MERKPLKRFAGLIATVLVALVLVGCKGSDGRDGTNGTNGTPGTTPSPTIAASGLSDDQWTNLKPSISVIGSPTLSASGPLSVTFEVKDAAGNRISGLDTWTTLSTAKNSRTNTYAFYPSYSNLAFSLAKLVPEDAATKAPSKWINYFITSIPAKLALADSTPTAPAALARPSNDNAGVLVQNADGTYTYTFRRDFATILSIYNAFADTATSLKTDLGSMADVTYDPTKIHRLVIQFNGSKRGTGSNTGNGVTTTAAVDMAEAVNSVYDWVPSTATVVTPLDAAQREVTTTNKCNECHDAIGTTTPHGGRVDTRYCVVCHNDQRKFGYGVAAAGTTTTYTGSTNKFAIDAAATMAAGDMPVMVHKIHMGNALTKTGYSYAGVHFEELAYPMGRDMCSKCHSGVDADATKKTAQGENWNTKPSRKACGSCHDSIDWTQPHPSSASAPQTSDNACAGCHVDATHTQAIDIKVAHYINNVNLTPNNPVVKAGLVNLKYEVSSVTQPTSGGSAVIKFRILSDQGIAGAPIGTPVVFKAPAAGLTAPLEGFTGAPGFLLAWSMTQEGITSPADYNNLTAGGVPVSSNHQPLSVSIAALLDTTKTATDGSITAGPDANGYYTATLAAAKSFPAGAKLRSVALQGYFTQTSPAAPRHAVAAYAYLSGESRRKVIDSNKCSNCHEWFEGHGGNRVKEVQVCVMCHVPGLTTSGRGVADSVLNILDPASQNYATLVSWGVNPAAANAALAMPQTTNNMKDMIHGLHMGKKRTEPIRIARDFRGVVLLDGSKFVFPGLINKCTDCHTYNGYSGVPANTLATREEAVNVAGNTTVALAKSALGTLNPGDLMTTPFTASCVSCHDTSAAQAHMRLNGGQIKIARNGGTPETTLNTAAESCAVCHGSGSTYDPVKVHK